MDVQENEAPIFHRIMLVKDQSLYVPVDGLDYIRIMLNDLKAPGDVDYCCVVVF